MPGTSDQSWKKSMPAHCSNFIAFLTAKFSLLIYAFLVYVCCNAFSSCSLDYGSALDKNLSGDVPDTVLYDFVHTVVESGSPRFRIMAKRAEAYQSQKLIRLYNVHFIEYSPEKSNTKGISEQIVSEGSADRAVFYTDTESAVLSGSVYLLSAKEDSIIESSYLEWDGESKSIKSRSDAITSISKGDGSKITGAGFSADSSRRSFSFGKFVSGHYSSSNIPEAEGAK